MHVSYVLNRSCSVGYCKSTAVEAVIGLVGLFVVSNSLRRHSRMKHLQTTKNGLIPNARSKLESLCLASLTNDCTSVSSFVSCIFMHVDSRMQTWAKGNGGDTHTAIGSCDAQACTHTHIHYMILPVKDIYTRYAFAPPLSTDWCSQWTRLSKPALLHYNGRLAVAVSCIVGDWIGTISN